MFERIAPNSTTRWTACRAGGEPFNSSATPRRRQRWRPRYRAGKLPHALLFAGPPGIGKATLAFHLAHHLPAPRTLTRAGGACPARSGIDAVPARSPIGAHPSLLHLTRPAADSGKGFKTVDHRSTRSGAVRALPVDDLRMMAATGW